MGHMISAAKYWIFCRERIIGLLHRPLYPSPSRYGQVALSRSTLNSTLSEALSNLGVFYIPVVLPPSRTSNELSHH